jgi:glycosyltransferase involved in cell wall biosynthesis
MPTSPSLLPREVGVTSLDVIVPIYNEAAGIRSFHVELSTVLAAIPLRCAIYYVNDGSTDGTAAELATIARDDPRVVVLELSRNFGHQAALTAGLDSTTADVVVMLDGDGQHPPEAIPEMLRLQGAGYDVVLTQRVSVAGGRVKRQASRAFYRILALTSGTEIRKDSADFRLITRTVVEALRSMREAHRFLRGMVGWLGFRTVVLPYRERPRYAGAPKYSLGKMLRLAHDATFSFSALPLYLALSAGVLLLLLAGGEAIYVLQFWLRGRSSALVPGWSSLMLMLLFVGGTIMICLGIVGLYLGSIFQEVKSRPIYVVRSVLGRTGPDDSAR